MGMSQSDKDEIKELILEAVKEAAPGRCCAESCHERCGITPLEHAQQHQEWKAFNASMGSIGKKAVGTVITTVIGFALMALAIGLYHMIKNFKG